MVLQAVSLVRKTPLDPEAVGLQDTPQRTGGVDVRVLTLEVERFVLRHGVQLEQRIVERRHLQDESPSRRQHLAAAGEKGRRLGDMLSRIRGRIIHKPLDHVSPLAVPVMLEIGREQVYGEASEELLREAEAELVKEAMQ